jgi:hypothetical protein
MPPVGGADAAGGATVGTGVGVVVGEELLPPHWTTVPRTAAAQSTSTAVLDFILRSCSCPSPILNAGRHRATSGLSRALAESALVCSDASVERGLV